MRYTFVTAAALCLGFVAATSVAAAAEATPTTCNQLDTQVRSALDSNQQSANRDQAIKERNSGRQFCESGFYKVGGEHYSQALRLLGGASAQAPSGTSQSAS